MKNIIVIFICASFMLQSCASLLNGKYQKVTIKTGTDKEILVNGKAPKKEGDYYIFRRDRRPKQITVQKEGYKDANYVLIANSKSPWFALSCVPFGITVVIPIYDVAARSWNYKREYNLENTVREIPKRDKDSKEIRILNLGVEVDSKDMVYKEYYSYNKYLNYSVYGDPKPNNGFYSVSSNNQALNVRNTIFSEALNDLLKKSNYIDTTNTVLNKNYLNNLLVNATIKEIKLTRILNRGTYTTKIDEEGLVLAEVTIKWEIVDTYNKSIFKSETKTVSDHFAVIQPIYISEIFDSALKDATELGLFHFINKHEVHKRLRDKSELKKEESLEELILPSPGKYISNLNEAIKSAVTITNENGHGSGFIISEIGHIITNYHVVKDTSNLKVVLNDGSEYKAEVIRISKVHDLALLKIQKTGLLPFKISNSRNFEIALEVYAIGTPTAQEFSQTISQGIISGIRKTKLGINLIQTDASINPGNSGGVIITEEGVALGVVSSKLEGYGIEGVAFGIPAYEIFDKLKVKFNH